MKSLEATDYNTTLWNAAQWYIKQGYYVVPIKKGGKALPPSSMGISYAHATNKPDIIKAWFHPELPVNGGKFKGWNIGIATGKEDGVFVMDIDKHGDVNGYDTLNSLEKLHGKLPDTPYQKTPNEGMHLIFKWRENAVSTTSKLGPGIDTRGGESDICRAHILLCPSKVNGKGYEWMGIVPPPAMP